MEIINVVKILTPSVTAFFIGIALTPFLTHYLYKYKMWKKYPRLMASDGRSATLTHGFNAEKETKTPKMGGVVIWGSSIITIFIFWLIAQTGGALFEKLDFFSRGQTWLPLFTLMVGALIGLFDDYLETKGLRDYFAGGLSLKKRLLLVFGISLIGAWWFYSKLGVTSILIPFLGEMDIGLVFIPVFSIIMIATYAGGVIDGIDGLAGGIFAVAFSAYGIIAFAQNQIDLASLSFVIVGGLLAFLWFNIPPARFYMGETGSMALTLVLTVIAFLTQQILVLPIIAILLYLSAFSSAIQLISKKMRNGKKVFLAAPLHYHFLALGWPTHKVTMRFWVISVVFAVLGTIVALIS